MRKLKTQVVKSPINKNNIKNDDTLSLEVNIHF